MIKTNIYKKIKAYTFYVASIIILAGIIGFVITFKAYASEENDYNKFQSAIDKMIGQDPNLTHTYDSPSLSTDMFNIKAPIQVNTNWSDLYGLTLSAYYATLLGDNNAIAVEGDWGTLENRINLTWGYAFSPKNRIKLSAERLAQKQTFDFYSGSIDEWVSQYAGGAEVQHIIGKGFFNNISAGSYYARSGSKSLDPINYTDENGTPWINYRHIAGANSVGGHISFGLKPWETGMITLTSYYDSVHYNTLYGDVSADDSTSLGYGVTLEQYISQAIKASAAYSHRALYNTIQTSLQFFHNIRHNTAAIGMALGYEHNDYNDTNAINDGTNSENTYTLGLQYYFMPIKNGYTVPQFNQLSLLAWTSDPAVRMETVLAAADQENVKIDIQWSPNFHSTLQNLTTVTLQWNPNATSNDPNSTITYKLTVTGSDKASGYNYNYEANVTQSKGKTTLTNLQRDITYQANLVATDHPSGKTRSVSTSFSTSNHNYLWDPHVFESNKTSDSTQLNWVAANRTIPTEDVTYKFTLTNENNPEDILTVKKVSSVAAGQQISTVLAVGKTLTPGATYNIKITATDESEDDYQVNNSGISQISAGGKPTIEWVYHPITIKIQNQTNSDYYITSSWKAATIDQQAPENKVIYTYKVFGRYGDIDGEELVHRFQSIETTDTSVQKTTQVSTTYKNKKLNYIQVSVIANDSEGEYDPQTRQALLFVGNTQT